MKPIVIPAAPMPGRKAYAIKRMNVAAQRLLHAKTVAEEIRAGHWALAWAVAAGARPSSRSVEASVYPLAQVSLH